MPQNKQRNAKRRINEQSKNKKSEPSVKKASVPEQEKIRVDGEIKRRENKYYRSLSERYRIAGFVFFLLFVVFCGVMMIRHSEYITYDNFVYLIRDFDNMGQGDGASVDEMSIELSDSSAIRPFRGGFAVADNDKVTVYDSTGVVLLSETERFSYPSLAVSDKYLIAYDIGGESYSIYNSITRIVSKKTEFPIVCASVCDNGSFIIVTESDQAKYVIEVYNTALQNIMNIYKDKYVTSASISSDGQWIIASSLSESGADFAAELSFYKVGESSAQRTLYYSMAMPLLTENLDGGNFMFLCDDAIRFYTPSGELLSETSVGDCGLAGFDAEGCGVMLVCRENSIGTQNRVYTFDTEGNIIYNSSIGSRVTGMSVSQNDSGLAGYIINGDTVYSLGTENSSSDTFEGEVSCIIETSSGAYAYITGKAVRIENAED